MQLPLHVTSLAISSVTGFELIGSSTILVGQGSDGEASPATHRMFSCSNLSQSDHGIDTGWPGVRRRSVTCNTQNVWLFESDIHVYIPVHTCIYTCETHDPCLGHNIMSTHIIHAYIHVYIHTYIYTYMYIYL